MSEPKVRSSMRLIRRTACAVMTGMKTRILYRLFGLVFAVSSAVAGLLHSPTARAEKIALSAHEFSFTSIEGTPLPLSDFKGKAVLLVNTASFCGFTPQYEELQALWNEFRESGLVILGVPSNDFGAQEPGSNSEIQNFCEGIYGIDFPLTEKVSVKGSEAHPFYLWSRKVLGPEKAPRWNFHKYLIDPQGRPADGFATTVRPSDPVLRARIRAVLPSM